MPTLTDTLRLILTLGEARPAPSLPRRLDGLFRQLAEDPADPHAVEDLIWALWTNHPDPQVDAAMNQAIAAVAGRRLEAAHAMLDALVAAYPDWAEAWNKRATLLFLMGRDEDSIADIHRTLKLEPRHFGALCGFAQIALRQGHPAAARAAFEAALAVNPHLTGVREMVERLESPAARTLH